jgi:hypothetical protein
MYLKIIEKKAKKRDLKNDLEIFMLIVEANDSFASVC